MIEDFLETLTVENRVIFMRRYWFSDSYEMIARRVGITEKNVSVRLTRMRKQLRNFLIEREVLV
jgi:RNA polymerase sigma-70 factor (ECF subfamily)